MEVFMKHLIKFCAIFMILTTFNLQVQGWLPSLEILENEVYPANMHLSEKTVDFELPKYDEAMYLYLITNGPQFQRSQRFEIQNQQKLTISLLPAFNDQSQISMYLFPKKDAEAYIKELKNINDAFNASNEKSISYLTGKLKEERDDLNHSRNFLMNKYQNKFIQVARLNPDKITNEQKMELPEYTPMIPKTNAATAVEFGKKIGTALGEVMNTEHPTRSPKMMANPGERILTLRIPEQEIKVGIHLGN
jgi:hypothetical protein